MGFFDFLKKSSIPTKGHQAQEVVVNSFGERMDMLTKDGELPFGWETQNKNFTERINREFSYFLQLWLDARNKSPKELYSALKSFVLYLEDAERLCKSKGECFEFWFYEILTAPNYVEERKAELRELEINLNYLQRIYERKLNLRAEVITILKENDGILQSEFKKLFDEPLQQSVTAILFEMQDEGKIEKIKLGRSFALYYKAK